MAWTHEKFVDLLLTLTLLCGTLAADAAEAAATATATGGQIVGISTLAHVYPVYHQIAALFIRLP